MKYIIGLCCFVIAIMMYLHLDVFNDTQTIFGTVFILLGNLFINCKRGDD